MAESHPDPAKLHAAVASTATTLNGEDLDSKTPVPSLGGEKDDLDLGVDEKQQDSVVEAPTEDGELREDEYPSGIKMFFIVLALVLSVFLLSLDMVSLYPSFGGEEMKWLGLLTAISFQTIVATAIPKITDEFQGLDKAGWYGAAFFMTVGAFQSTCKQFCPLTIASHFQLLT
jgi:hypothetical protein